MKNFNRIFSYAICIVLWCVVCVGCSQHSDDEFKYDRNYQYSSGEYKSMGAMLTKCKGVTIVVAVGINEGSVKSAKHRLTVVDSKGTAFEYAGAKLELTRLDTVKWENNKP